MIQIEWDIKSFKALDTDDLYELLKLRVDVFVVEQNCPYPEIDGKDRHPETRHLIGKNTDGKILAYLRVLPPGLSFKQVSIGRVVVDKNSRGQGISNVMVKKALDLIDRIWPEESIQIGAQVYLMSFYQALGFKAVSENYLEDGILHIDMIRKANI